MRYVSSIAPPPVIEIGGRKVKAVNRVSQPPRPHGHDHPVEPDQQPRPAPYPEERRKAQRRITNEPVLMDRRSGYERRRYDLFRHIDEEV